MVKIIKLLLAMALMSAIWACVQTRHEVDVKPVEVKPIHITIDVNIKVDKALDDFFGDCDFITAEDQNRFQYMSRGRIDIDI